jgi:hypothetical protein
MSESPFAVDYGTGERPPLTRLDEALSSLIAARTNVDRAQIRMDDAREQETRAEAAIDALMESVRADAERGDEHAAAIVELIARHSTSARSMPIPAGRISKYRYSEAEAMALAKACDPGWDPSPRWLAMIRMGEISGPAIAKAFSVSPATASMYSSNAVRCDGERGTPSARPIFRTTGDTAERGSAVRVVIDYRGGAA